LIDFSICQHVTTGGWFFNFEKDLLCSAQYHIDPVSGSDMVLGGTQGPGYGKGGVWGRIWCPNVYSEWLPESTLWMGTILSATPTSIVVDVSGGLAFTQDLVGRWALITDANGEYAQVAYIWSHTQDTLTFDSVTGGLNATRLNPVPSVGWKFYLGMIECRWGPKRFDFGDPDVVKKVWEIWSCVSGYNETLPPFIRLYRGFEDGYTAQLRLTDTVYLDRTKAQSLVNKVDHKLEQCPRWAMLYGERSYNQTILHSLTIVFSREQEIPQK
jgi:hypothetical protein